MISGVRIHLDCDGSARPPSESNLSGFTGTSNVLSQFPKHRSPCARFRNPALGFVNREYRFTQDPWGGLHKSQTDPWMIRASAGGPDHLLQGLLVLLVPEDGSGFGDLDPSFRFFDGDSPPGHEAQALASPPTTPAHVDSP